VRNVSITFQNTGDAQPIIEAIRADNPDATVQSMPSIVKIDCPGRLTIKASSVSDRIGREWDPQELHMSLISLSGNVDEDDDLFELSWKSA
jgi:phenol hydroxylase P2 protein